MIKALFALIVLLALTYFALPFFGYEIHHENISYYLPKKTDENMTLSLYMDNAKYHNRIHPLISKKKGPSEAENLDKSSTNLLKQLAQVDKIEQLEKLSKQVKEIQAKAVENNKEIEKSFAV